MRLRGQFIAHSRRDAAPTIQAEDAFHFQDWNARLGDGWYLGHCCCPNPIGDRQQPDAPVAHQGECRGERGQRSVDAATCEINQRLRSTTVRDVGHVEVA